MSSEYKTAKIRVVGPTGGLRTYADWLWYRGTRPVALIQVVSVK